MVKTQSDKAFGPHIYVLSVSAYSPDEAKLMNSFDDVDSMTYEAVLKAIHERDPELKIFRADLAALAEKHGLQAPEGTIAGDDLYAATLIGEKTRIEMALDEIGDRYDTSSFQMRGYGLCVDRVADGEHEVHYHDSTEKPERRH